MLSDTNKKQVEDNNLAMNNKRHPLPAAGNGQPNPALQSLRKFGGMLNKNVAQPVAAGLNYANPVTFTKNLWDAAGRLPQTINQIDANYGNRVRSDLAQLNKQNKSPLPTPTNQQIANNAHLPIQEDHLDPFNKNGYKPDEYANGVEVASSPRPHQVDTVSQQLDQNPPASGAVTRLRIPDGNIATKDGWRSKEDVLPGNDFNQANTKDYFNQTGYLSDNDPQMVKRRNEAKEVQAGRERFIKNSQSGMYDLGPGPTISKGLPFPVGNKGPAYAPRFNTSNGIRPQQSLGAQKLAFEQEKLEQDKSAQQADSYRQTIEQQKPFVAGDNVWQLGEDGYKAIGGSDKSKKPELHKLMSDPIYKSMIDDINTLSEDKRLARIVEYDKEIGEGQVPLSVLLEYVKSGYKLPSI